MKKQFVPALSTLLILALASFVQPAAAQQDEQSQNNAPIYHVTLVGGSITAVKYEHRNGSTEIGFQGTPLLSGAKGSAKVDSKPGRITINAEFKNLQQPQMFGPEYLTYVLWAITPEGKPSNLGELVLNGNNGKASTTTSLQNFGMIVTAEPYFAVTQPSNVVVLENVVLPNTVGTMQPVTANYELLKRGQYSYNIAMRDRVLTKSKSKVPLEVEEAVNAVEIARAAGAERYAPDSFAKAQAALTQAQTELDHRGDKKQVIASARDAVQTAADARQIAIQKQAQEEAAEKDAEAARRAQQARDDAAAAAAKAAAQQQQDEAARAQAEAQAEQSQREAQEQTQARAQAQQQAEAAQQAAAQSAAAATQAQQAAAQAEQEKQQLRASLLQQFNRILPTTDTSRGLKVNMADVLFATAKYDLRPPAREALAKFSGIVLAHPGLKLQIEGFTDSTGPEAFNQTLSEKRANAVRDYLMDQGLSGDSIAAQGFGESNPVASNDTAEGRAQNRRVDIIISGDIIGTPIGTNPNPAPNATPQQYRIIFEQLRRRLARIGRR